MMRTTQEVFDAHQKAFESGDLDLLLTDYADDVIFLTLDGAYIGKEAVRGFFEYIFKTFVNPKISFDKTAVEGDTFLLQWSGDSDVAAFPYGVATFIIWDGLIQRQTEWFTMEPKGP